MTYEFNPDTSAPELPNPYKVENQCLFGAGLVVMVCGALLLYLVHGHLAAGLDGRGAFAFVLTAGLLLVGVTLIWSACTQLRFLFGRSRPRGLAPELENYAPGNSRDADYYKETLRQNAIRFDEPHGAINGVLYSVLRDLVFAPRVVRLAAEKLLQKFVWLAVTLLSFLICWSFTSGGAAGWCGVVYALAAAPALLLPLSDPLAPIGTNPGDDQALTPVRIVAAIVGAVIGSLIIGKLAQALPSLGSFSINAVLTFSLICALAGCAVFALALKNQLQPAPQAIGAARVQEAITINTHPSKLIEELDRLLMERWYSRIPNRRYSRSLPQVNEAAGAFTAEVFEEVQPRPHAKLVAGSLGDALTQPCFRFLAALTLLAATFTVCGAAAATVAGAALMEGQAFSTSLALAAGLFVPSLFCFRAAHLLWGRFDFISELIWVELSGSYEAAHVNIGNQFTGNLHTSKNVINVEAMTLRVWVSEIDTVIFGKDGGRQLIGMRGLQGRADELAKALQSFGETRSVVVAPRAAQDIERIASISAANAAGAQGEEWSRLVARAAGAARLQGD